jgi:hypothetical protein
MELATAGADVRSTTRERPTMIHPELSHLETSGGGAPARNPVIDPRIDVFAQRALLRMGGGDPAAQANAAGMLAAVKSGQLGGIYKEDERVPALRAQRLGLGWWQLIPPERGATVVWDPDSEPMLIVFRDAIRSNAALLDAWLRWAWHQVEPWLWLPPRPAP